MDKQKLEQFGKLQDEIYEKTKGDFSLVTFYDDTQGINVHNPMLDVSGRFFVDPIKEYGKENISYMENRISSIERNIGLSIFDITPKQLRFYLGKEHFLGKKDPEWFMDIPFLEEYTFTKSGEEMTVDDVICFEIPIFEGAERIFPEALHLYMTPFAKDDPLNMYALYDILTDQITLHATCKGKDFVVNPPLGVKDFLKEKMNILVSEIQADGISYYGTDHLNEAIYKQLKETLKKEWFINEEKEGTIDIEISADYRESNAFLLQTAYDHRNESDLLVHLENEIYESYEPTIVGYQNELLENAGFIEGSDLYERAKDILYETIFFHPDYDHFLRDDLKINLLLGTQKESDVDFSDIHDRLAVHADKNSYAMLQKEAKEDGFEIEEPDNALLWLIKQQGYTLEDLRNVKEAYDAYFNGNEQETSSSYSERYEEFKRTHSAFLTSICQELENHSYSMGCLTILVETSLDEYCKMFERFKDDASLIPKEIVFDKNIELGIFDPWHGAGSCLDIELEKELVLPNTLIFDTQIEGVVPDNGTTVNHVYGLIDSCWKRCKEIKEPTLEERKASLDDQIKNAIKEEKSGADGERKINPQMER